MDEIASQITSLTIVYSAVYSDADQRKHQSSASLAFVWEFTFTGEFPAQMASNAENVSIWWRHHNCHKYDLSIGIGCYMVGTTVAYRPPILPMKFRLNIIFNNIHLIMIHFLSLWWQQNFAPSKKYVLSWFVQYFIAIILIFFKPSRWPC